MFGNVVLGGSAMKKGIFIGFLVAILVIGGGAVILAVTDGAFGSRTYYNDNGSQSQYQENPPVTVGTISNATLSGGTYREFHINAQPGQILTLNWASDSNLEAFIFSATQFNNFKPLGIPNGQMATSYGSQGSISFTVTNADTFYAVVTNRVYFASPVMLYSSSLVVK
jgi:hypothetical protein